MKHLFTLLLCLTLGNVLHAQCTYVIDLQDSFGDGWNGASLDVSINGAFFANYTLPNGSVGQVTFNAANLDVVTFVYNSGIFDGEVTYQITLAGAQLFADGPNPFIGQAFQHQCGGCDPVGSPTASNVTATTADLGWTAGGGNPTSFIVEYGTTGFAPGTGTFITTTNNPLNLTGLTPGTAYDYYISSICSSGDTSLATSVQSFATQCLAINNYPYFEGFNSNSTTQNCWTVLNENGDFDAWNMDNAFNAFEGDECAAINTDFNFGSNDDYLISPQLVLTGGERLRFKHRCNSTFEPNDFRVVLSTTGRAAADFTNVLLVDTSENTTYEEVLVDLSGFTGNAYVAFQIPPNGLDGWILFIDDVIIERPTQNDAGVTAMVSPALPTSPGFTSLAVEVTNLSIRPLNSFDVEWAIGGATQPGVSYNGPVLAPGETTVVTLANINLTNPNQDLLFWTTMPNGVMDEDPSNDTLAVQLCEGLAGIYTAGHPTADFATMDDVINALSSCGVSGPVTINVQSGTYTGFWTFPEIPGASANNTVTIDGLNPSDVTFTHSGSIANSAANFVLDGTRYLTIKNVTIENTGINGAYGVVLTNNAQYNTIEENVINMSTAAGVANTVGVLASSSAFSSAPGPATEGNNANWNWISANEINGGNAGIILEGGEIDSMNIGNRVLWNTIEGAADFGIFVDEQDSLVVDGNRVSNLSSGQADGIILRNVENFRLTRNIVNAPDFGISVEGNFGNPAQVGWVVNNMVDANNEGLRLQSVVSISTYHNTMRAGNRAMFVNNHINVDFRNNIMSTNTGTAFFTFNSNSLAFMDYNVYDVGGSGDAVEFGFTNYPTLADWQNLGPAGYDANSLAGNPGFVNGLFVSAPLAIDAGDPALLIPVLEDVTGEVRPQGTAPDIGADEYVIVSDDAIAIGIMQQEACGNPAMPIIIEVGNLGANNLVNTPVTVNVTGDATGAFAGTLPLVMPATSGTLNVGTINTAAGGTFNIEVIVSSSADVNPVNDTFRTTITLVPSNQVAISMTGDNIVCEDRRALIAATASYNPATILWYDAPTGGNLVHVGNSFTTNPLANAVTYYAEVQGCTSPRAMTTVMLDTIGINIDLGADRSICGGTPATLVPTITLSAATSITWSEGSQSDSIVTFNPGTYTATVINANGCSDIDTIQVNVAPSPVNSATVSNVTCGGNGDGAIDVTVSSGTAPYTFNWSNAAVTEDLTGLAGGFYNVSVTDANGCTTVSSYQVAEPTTLATNVDASSIACNTNDGTIDITVTGGSPAYTYNWSTGATTQDITNATAGVNTVTVTDANGCTNVISTTLAATTPIVIAVDSIMDEILALAGSIDISVTGGSGNYQYTWNTGATTQDLTSVNAGTYDVTVTDLNTGCQQVLTGLVVNYKLPDFVEKVGSVSEFTVYPNPTTGQVWMDLQLNNMETVQLEIINITGQVVTSFEGTETNGQIYNVDMSSYPSGVYLARFLIGKDIMTARIIVE